MIQNQIFNDFLHSKSLVELTNNRTQKVVTVSTEDTLEAALFQLSSNRVLSVPVLANGAFVGFLGMHDLVHHYLLHSTSGAEVALGAKVSSLVLPPNKALCLPDLCNVSSAVEAFGSGVHRLATVDKHGVVSHLFSQSDAVRFLWDGMQASEALRNEACKLTLPVGEVVSCQSTDSVRDALAILAERNINSIAVLDEEGHLVGNFSIRDFRGLARAHVVGSGDGTVGDFLRAHSPRSLSPITLTEHNNLFHVVRAMMANAVHGLWLVDAANAPVGRISMTDVLRLVVHADPVQREAIPRNYPISLTVEVRGVADLPKPATGVVVSLGYNQVRLSPTFPPALAATLPAPFVADFIITRDMAVKNEKLLLQVTNGPHVIGTVAHGLTWLLNGFGSGKAVFALEDNFQLAQEAGGDGAAKRTKTGACGVIEVALTRSL